MKYKDLKSFLKNKIFSASLSVIIAILGVAFGLLPYYAIYRLLLLLFLKEANINSLIFYTILAALGYFMQLASHYISTAISHKNAFEILENIRLEISKKMIRLPLGIVQNKGSGYFKNLISDEIERLEYPFAHALPETTSNVLIPIGIIIIIFTLDWRMGLSIIAPYVLTLLFYMPMYIGIMREFENTYYHAIENMNSKVIEYIIGIKEIKIFGRSKDAYLKYEESIDNYESSTLRLYNKMYYASAPAFVLLSSILVSVLIIGAYLYANQKILFPVFLFSIIASLGIGTHILKFIEFMDNFFHIKNGNRLVKEILSLPELDQRNHERVNLKNLEIRFEDVNFAYDKKEILKGLNLVFKENQKTALVGPSGSGKSTIANLLARFWDTSEGAIKIGGIDYKDIPLEQLMENINYITQDPFLFNISIKENIRIGKPNAVDEEVYMAAKRAYCDEFILDLEDGYDTIAGDLGAKLSGGQRQRIIIARAILKDSPILILDESTAFSDMENQKKIQDSLDELCKNKTLIVIAHRLSTIRNCDQIMVVNDGQVKNIGTHDELLNESDIYRNLWQIYLTSSRWSLERGEIRC